MLEYCTRVQVHPITQVRMRRKCRCFDCLNRGCWDTMLVNLTTRTSNAWNAKSPAASHIRLQYEAIDNRGIIIILYLVIGIVARNLYCAFAIFLGMKARSHGSRERGSSKSSAGSPCTRAQCSSVRVLAGLIHTGAFYVDLCLLCWVN